MTTDTHTTNVLNLIRSLRDNAPLTSNYYWVTKHEIQFAEAVILDREPDRELTVVTYEQFDFSHASGSQPRRTGVWFWPEDFDVVKGDCRVQVMLDKIRLVVSKDYHSEVFLYVKYSDETTPQ